MKFEPLKRVKRSVLLDTDIGPDCDDVGALVVLHDLARKYQITISAICNCTSNPYGCGAIDVVNRYCGAAEIPIGITGRRHFWDGPDTRYYNRLISERFHTQYFPVGEKKPENALKLYKEALQAAEDDSVIFVTIGMLNNLAELVETAPELLERKVYAFVTMAGRQFEKQKEFNVNCDGAAFRKFITEVKAPIFFSPFETGAAVCSGFTPEGEKNTENNPVFVSYREYLNAMRTEKTLLNASFDLTAVHFAFEGEGKYYKLSDAGEMLCDPSTEETVFRSGKGKDYCIELNCPESELGGYFSGILRNA